jgi:hypothetical protein
VGVGLAEEDGAIGVEAGAIVLIVVGTGRGCR